MNPKTDGLEMECVLDDGMNFVQCLSLVLQTFNLVLTFALVHISWFKSE